MCCLGGFAQENQSVNHRLCMPAQPCPALVTSSVKASGKHRTLAAAASISFLDIIQKAKEGVKITE